MPQTALSLRPSRGRSHVSFERVSRWVAIDAPLPGIGAWEQILQEPAMWHFGFGGHDMERLVAGRERIYLDRFWNELSVVPKRFDETKREHYATLYAQPGAMRASPSSWRSARTRQTTGNSLPRASCRCRSWPSAAKPPSAPESAR